MTIKIPRPLCTAFHRACRRVTLSVIVILAGVLSLLTVPVSADVFTISHVKVDEKAEDATKAKVKAISAAQLMAFRRLLRRITPVGSDDLLPQFGASEVSRMMSGMTFEEERSGPTRYIATLTISFLPDTVRELLYQYKVPFAEEQAPTVLLLPVWKTSSGLALWEGENPWKEAWVKLDLQNSLTPVLVPLGDLTDISAISAEEAASGDTVKLEALRLRYGAEKVLVSVAERRDDASIYATLAGETPFGAVNYAKAYPVTEEDVGTTTEFAAAQFMATMEEGWKNAVAKVNVPDANLNAITVAIPFDSLAEWNSIRARIQQTYGVGEVQIDSLSARGGIVKVLYEGDIQQFSNELQTNGLILSEVGDTWVIQPY